MHNPWMECKREYEKIFDQLFKTEMKVEIIWFLKLIKFLFFSNMRVKI